MRKGAMLGAIGAALVLAGTAQARNLRPLTLGQARHAIARYAATDAPTSIGITDCQRLSRLAIRCSVVESGVQLLWTDNGQPIIATIEYTAAARRVHRRVTVASSFLA